MNISLNGVSYSDPTIYTPMEYVFKISKPEMVENEFTVKDDRGARDIMQGLGIFDFDKLNELLDGLDFTAISTRELSLLCSELSALGINDKYASAYLSVGNQDTGMDGRPRNLDVKFNAIPLINEQLDIQIKYGHKEGLIRDKAYGRILNSFVNANHMVAALSYLAKSAQKLPSIDEHV